MSCSGSHLGIPINIKNTKDLPMIDAKLGSISAIASEKKIFLYFPIWSCVNTMTCGGSHLGSRIGIKNTNFLEDFQMIIPGQFGFNYPSCLREEAF
jgi:hypothetical protein